jgi:capsular polysaccharide export protein
MIAGGIEAFAGRNVLLLQGPVGPFFARLARDLRQAGARVWKVNFNGGDCLFDPGGMVWRGTMEAWPGWLEARLRALSIDVVMMFGDCRPVHQAAHGAATRLGIEVGVFEEGYLRPDFITLERHGVNGNSRWCREIHERAEHPHPTLPLPGGGLFRAVPRAFWPMVWWGFLYYAIGALTRWLFPHYRHHRAMTVAEAWPWLRSPWRKAWYALAERGMTEAMTGPWSGRFFLVPLQVHNDAQVHCHADPGGVPGFIARIVASFAQNAPADARLVIKHHPMDRGYCDYAAAIRRAARAGGVADRVHYIHDQHMPTILPHCRGVVVINSTAGLAAVGCGRPVKAMGAAIYARLTFQGSLARFWCDAVPPDPALYAAFRADLIATCQLNGNFYLRHDRASAAGLVWPRAPRSYAFTGSSSAGLPAGRPEPATI